MNRLPCVLVFTLTLLIALPLEAGVLTESPCVRGKEPAATLLFPYFEVDLGDPGGSTTLLAITNARAAPTLAKVIVWSDWALPVFSFHVYLTGYDVQTLNVRDLLAGKIPVTGPDSSRRGIRSDPDVDFLGCDPDDVGGAPVDVSFVQAALGGEEIDGRCWASPRFVPGPVVGYITVDVVKACSDALPTDEGYFQPGGTGVASNDNALVGDFFLVHPDEDFAQGAAAVHLVADADFFAPGDETFYSMYVGTSARDARIPLSDRYGVRFLRGGVFDGGTELIVWRGITGEAPLEPPVCAPGGFRSVAPAWLSHLEFKVVFDEEENPLLLDSPISDSPTFLQATQKMPVWDFIPWSFGWADMDLGGQAWVGAVMSAQGRFSVGVEAWVLNDLCTAE